MSNFETHKLKGQILYYKGYKGIYAYPNKNNDVLMAPIFQDEENGQYFTIVNNRMILIGSESFSYDYHVETLLDLATENKLKY